MPQTYLPLKIVFTSILSGMRANVWSAIESLLNIEAPRKRLIFLSINKWEQHGFRYFRSPSRVYLGSAIAVEAPW